MAILIVDDDAALCETLVDQLAVDGEFTAIAVGTIGEAEAKLGARGARFGAVILDVRLPDGDGRDLCAKLRQQGQQIPIIMLTGSDAETDVIRGLDSGANDYIAKPFRSNELLARLRAQVRIFEDGGDAVFVIGPYTFRPSAKLLEDPVGNRSIRLTEKEAGILKFLEPSRGTGWTAGATERGLGLQRCGRHAHAGDPHLPAAPEDRARSGEPAPTGDRGRRLSTGSWRRAGCGSVIDYGTERNGIAHGNERADPLASPFDTTTDLRWLTRRLRFTIDLCAASEKVALLPRFFSRTQNALKQDWQPERGFCNCPFARGSTRLACLRFCQRYSTADRGQTNREATIAGGCWAARV